MEIEELLDYVRQMESRIARMKIEASEVVHQCDKCQALFGLIKEKIKPGI